MLNNRDYRHDKHRDFYSESDISQVPRRAGSRPTAKKVKLAGRCSAGYALYYVNGSETPEHVHTPVDDKKTREHKKTCRG